MKTHRMFACGAVGWFALGWIFWPFNPYTSVLFLSGSCVLMGIAIVLRV